MEVEPAEECWAAKEGDRNLVDIVFIIIIIIIVVVVVIVNVIIM